MAVIESPFFFFFFFFFFFPNLISHFYMSLSPLLVRRRFFFFFFFRWLPFLMLLALMFASYLRYKIVVSLFLTGSLGSRCG